MTVHQLKPQDDIDKAFENYNVIAEEFSLPKVRLRTPARRRNMKAILDEVGLEGWNEALEGMAVQPFLLGENDRKWTAHIDFLLRMSSFVKVYEGAYANKE